MKGPQYATVNTPPNNEKFDALGTGALAEKSPLLQRRLQLNAEAKATTTQEIHNHMHIPPELLGVFRPQATAPTAAQDTVPMLLPSALNPGPKLTIEEFCAIYSLSNEILSRLRENGYSGSHVIQHIEIGELRSMQFKPGEIAELKEAVRVWATDQT